MHLPIQVPDARVPTNSFGVVFALDAPAAI
jgi:hypothetical protein